MSTKKYFHLLLIGISLPLVSISQDEEQAIQAYQEASLLFVAEGETLKASIKYLDESWSDGYIPVLLDVLHFLNYNKDSKPIVALLEKHTGQKFGTNLDQWNHWSWNKEAVILPKYGDWLANLYENIDPRFVDYFHDRTATAKIRLDEIKWGGVAQDGIPPLRKPKMVSAEEAKYLGKFDVVFGISINGDHRAYPKRILAWHEMFVDQIGGVPMAGVYCTLCGTVIAYESQFDGRVFELGTSGFLYRSNKLMYDKKTQSLWNTIEGRPVVGPLVDQHIELPTHSVVTTTWGDWKKRHPKTKVLSIDTGHERDYGEGKAYEQYFATDKLMFQVPQYDKRLANKDEVLIVRLEGYQNDPLAISSRFLKKHKVYHDKANAIPFVVLTDKSGAHRAYFSEDLTFRKLNNEGLLDKKGQLWKIKEEFLIGPERQMLNRIPTHRIFWFAWFSMYNATRLVD